MKTLYKTYNRDNINDEIILNNLRELSKGKLDMDLAYVEANNLFESNVKSGDSGNYSNQQNNQQNIQRKKQNQNQNQNQNQRRKQ